MSRHRDSHPLVGQGDLLDLLPDTAREKDEPAVVLVHILMPNMGLACGQDTLTVLSGRRASGRTITTMPDRATCPDCLAVDLARRIHAMQTRSVVTTRRGGRRGGRPG